MFRKTGGLSSAAQSGRKGTSHLFLRWELSCAPRPENILRQNIFSACKRMEKTGENHHILLTSIFIGVSIGLIAKWRTLSQNYC
ncbi:hypothetical protein RO602_12010 [Akkermansia muciniphila]|jgi:hypothetical protein|uniref:hypothetical protein n=1 Tax=Akkermansia muciniphila TaxID=239935 RepID=UPI001BFFD94F|nr:hypothetical protein [Akkermansia muciniphila]MBT8783581.1 hypothetical protein [Akkermansia muciniphila]MBT9592142.1 hypothetical protein [Akkermansia muciniphila]MDT4469072.1 hypothetical protein [Akkermansia muciniphila]